MLRGPALAIAYGRQHLSAFFPDHEAEISRLLSAALYMPLDRLLKTPFKDIFLPYPTLKVDSSTHLYLPQHIHSSHLIPLFIAAYCARNNLPREHGLKVITDVGGGGALSKLLKCITVTSAKKTTWESTTELPIELPPPLLDYRFHSVFSCPVSKEHAGCDEAATDGDEEMDGAAPEGNWPMMLPCGHVIARDTLDKLAKGGQCVPACVEGLTDDVRQADGQVSILSSAVDGLPGTASVLLIARMAVRTLHPSLYCILRAFGRKACQFK
jgi:hypothetical protein